jgi:LacI family transcriptional regulator
MSTIRDVAKRAGVSTMTVSRVINNSGYISQDARERVERAISELDYMPNALARSLRFKQTKTIALSLADITNPFFTTLARGVADMAEEHGFSVLFCNTDESEAKELDYLTIFLQKQVDGVLLVPASETGEAVAMLTARGVPVVTIDRRVQGEAVDLVRCNSEQGGYDLTRHLIGLGHTRIAAISGPRNVSTAQDRVAGYLRALGEADIAPDERLIQYGEYTEAGGYRMASEMIRLEPRPTALFTANNFLAFGAYRAIREAGLRVPDQISMVTFDDLPPLLILEPFLTVVSQPAYEIGQQAMAMLLRRLAGEGPTRAQELVLPTTLIVNRSSGRPPTIQ